MPTADPAAPEAAPSSSKRWLIPVLALVLGAGGAAAFAQSDALRQSVGLAGAPAEEADAEVPVEYGEFTELDGIVVNPRGTDGRRYLMIRLGVEAAEAETLARLDLLRPAAVDAVIRLMSDQSIETLTDITQRDSLKEEIRTQFNTILGEDGPVSRVYFTQYVIQ